MLKGAAEPLSRLLKTISFVAGYTTEFDLSIDSTLPGLNKITSISLSVIFSYMFTVTKSKMQPQCFSANEFIKEMVHFHWLFYLIPKGDDVVCNNIGGPIGYLPTEISQTQGNTLCGFIYT